MFVCFSSLERYRSISPINDNFPCMATYVLVPLQKAILFPGHRSAFLMSLICDTLRSGAMTLTQQLLISLLFRFRKGCPHRKEKTKIFGVLMESGSKGVCCNVKTKGAVFPARAPNILESSAENVYSVV